MIRSWIILLWFGNSITWEPCESVYQRGTTERILKKISRMTLELVMDAERKITLVQSYETTQRHQKVYQWGELVYKIRKNLEGMIILYRQAQDVIKKGKKNMAEDINKLVLVEGYGREIDHFVAMIELSKKQSLRQVKHTGKSLRSYESKIWQNLMHSDNYDLDPKPPPSVTEKDGRKINQKWQYGIIYEFDK